MGFFFKYLLECTSNEVGVPGRRSVFWVCGCVLVFSSEREGFEILYVSSEVSFFNLSVRVDDGVRVAATGVTEVVVVLG